MFRMSTWFVFACIFSFGISSHAQNVNFNQRFHQVERLIENENFTAASSLLEKLLSENPDNANLQFKLGYCYLNSSVDKKKALNLLTTAAKNKSKKYQYENPKEINAPYEIDFFLAQAFFHNHRFVEADKLFNSFKTEIKPFADDDLLAEIDLFILWNNNAARLASSPLAVKMVHLPEGINTPAIEYAPVLSGDEQTLIFTSSRSNNTDIDDSDDLFIVQKEEKSWGTPVRMADIINTSGHEASASLSFDGLTLIIYVNDNGNGNLYQSRFDGQDWGMPELMGDLINSPSQETHGCFSPDNNEFYFTSDRPEGFGGLDIYMVRKLPNGQWGMPVNLGSEINTPYDEETPFMHPDNNRLYFSSQGHQSMGGHDIFVSQRNNEGTWKTPTNIGYPINSTTDDVCFSVSADGKRGYYCSFNEQSFGETDLFMIEMPGEDHTNLMVYSGFAKNELGEVIPNADITAYDEKTGELFGVYTPNYKTGKFVLAAPSGMRIRLTIEAKGYETIEKHIEIGANVQQNAPNTEFSTKEMQLESLSMRAIPIQKIAIDADIFMPYDSYETTQEAYMPLKELLVSQQLGRVTLIGHTDAKGPAWYNNALSLKRAQHVRKNLIANGVDKSRITVKAMGETSPKAKNIVDGCDSPEGRAFNRRVSVIITDIDESFYSIKHTNIPTHLKITP